MIREIAIALFNSPGGIEEGDIIECREPTKGIGTKEGSRWIWFRADISEALAGHLKDPCISPSGIVGVRGKFLFKRRYKIPLEKIIDLRPDFDMKRARDLDNEYQPLIAVDRKMLFVDPDLNTFELEKLSIIYDKLTGEFI